MIHEIEVYFDIIAPFHEIPNYIIYIRSKSASKHQVAHSQIHDWLPEGKAFILRYYHHKPSTVSDADVIIDVDIPIILRYFLIYRSSYYIMNYTYIVNHIPINPV